MRNWLGAEQVLTYPQPSLKLTNGVATWLHFDHLGSVRAITDAGGVKVESAIYRPFGEQSEWLLPGTPAPETKGWIGERFDADAGLQYLNARYYDPALGLFLQPDWFEVLAAGTNRFSYCSGDPVNCSDANGNVPDNWATEDNQTAYDSNGFVSTYQGEGKLDKVEYASWNDHQNADYDTYMDHPGSYDPFSEGGDIGVLTERTSYYGGAYGRNAHTSYGSVEKISVAEYRDPPIQSPFIEADIALALVGAWEVRAILSSRPVAEAKWIGYYGVDQQLATRYVGITSRNATARGAEHIATDPAKAGLAFGEVPGAAFKTKLEARIWEQTQINKFGLNTLLNKRNEIAQKFWDGLGIR